MNKVYPAGGGRWEADLDKPLISPSKSNSSSFLFPLVATRTTKLSAVALFILSCIAIVLIILGVLGYLSPSNGVSNIRPTHTIWAQNTAYGARDSCPPSGEIAFANMSTNLPKTHSVAGGLGSPQDPITFAAVADAGIFPVGTIVYSPRLHKYFIFEDICAECESEYNETRHLHLDLWIGPDYVTGRTLIGCENALTRDNVSMIVNPPPNLPVNVVPLYDSQQTRASMRLQILVRTWEPSVATPATCPTALLACTCRKISTSLSRDFWSWIPLSIAVCMCRLIKRSVWVVLVAIDLQKCL